MGALASVGKEAESAALHEMAPAPLHIARVEALTTERLEEVLAIQNEFLADKRCCCCCSITETLSELAERYAQFPELLPLAAVALGADTDKPIGFVRMSVHGIGERPFWDNALHELAPGEAYIETMAVSAGNRGQGAGLKMLEFCERTARERGATKLTLGVLNGNPARRLYERFGFAPKPASACDEGGACCCVLLILGRPYGVCRPECGAIVMEKPLSR